MGPYLVETVEVSLPWLLLHHTRLLQQIVGYDAAHRIGLVVELNVHVFAESAGVVVAIRLRIAERLQYRIALDQHVLHSAGERIIYHNCIFIRLDLGHPYQKSN